jgi:DNA-binding MarR family transcriptional regulator
MELAGLVSRTRDVTDERRVLIALTPKGRDLREPARVLPAALSAQLAIADADVTELRDLVRELVAVLQATLSERR